MKHVRETRWHRFSNAEYNERWIARVMSNCVRNESGCLIWNGSLNNSGYPQTNYRAKTVRCHRMLWQIAHQVQLPKNVAVCHTCDERKCLEQTHHWTGTWQENLQDCAKKNRHTNGAKTHCRKGHEYTPENTAFTDAGKGRKRRSCRICNRIRNRLKSGWTHEEATASTAPIPQGALTPRRDFGQLWRKRAA